MASTTSPHNWSFQAIPYAFVLGLVPHGYYLTRLMIATKGQQSNAMPRTNLEAWKGKLSTDLWNHLVRARGAHINSLEVFPLFATAVVAGSVAKVPAQDMNSMVWSFFAARVLYMGLYIGVTNNTLALARTGAYAWSITIPSMFLLKAGKSMAAN